MNRKNKKIDFKKKREIAFSSKLLYLLSGMVGTFAIIALLLFYWMGGTGNHDKVATTSQDTLKSTMSKPKLSSSSMKKITKPNKKKVSATPASSKKQNTVNATPSVTTAPQTTARPTPTVVTYTATIGNYTRTSTLSQANANQLAQAAYDAAIAKEKQYEEEAEQIKTSILEKDPTAIVNITHQ
ncbi:hypothetical protein [Lactococcus allomyrinae]|uniref:Uncharacterized protein n=1 Tax=Lactococcus allomyrinae TaxID=2419773 RepID=A0A387BBL3_9LACT|nr:hypothetical protein [Lactococcus allomyrinae]AYG01153.1 hypothetical protein D7I46_08620 [Lactococcus allomyrinae]